MNRPSILYQNLLSVVVLSAAILSVPGLASADRIAIQSEIGDCMLADNVPGLHTVTVIHKFNPGSLVSRFKIEPAGGMTMTYVSETHGPASIGSMREGITMCYAGCAVGDVVLGTITFQGYGTSNSCARLVVKPHPDAETLDIVTCGNEMKRIETFPFEVVGPDGGCMMCHVHADGISYPGEPHMFGCQALPVATSTWGSIKALYR